jgi:hypothetical protein
MRKREAGLGILMRILGETLESVSVFKESSKKIKFIFLFKTGSKEI